MDEKVVKKFTMNIPIKGKTVCLCQLGYEDPSKQSLFDIAHLFLLATRDFHDLDLTTVSVKVFGDTFVPDSVGIAFYVSEDATIPDDYQQFVIYK